MPSNSHSCRRRGWNGTAMVTFNYVSHVLRYYSTAGSSGSGIFGYPIKVGKYTISSPFGYRSNPTTGKYTLHKGVDFAAAYGTPIYASESGKVIFADFGITGGGYGGYGNVVAIQHSSSTISLYGHCSQLLVKKGDTVQKGQVIALVGSTGESTGNHCHFEIRENGKAVDPMGFLK
ncbi:M23 family metallopeptidase [Caproiciproducens sp. CPB-2]|uniref:M23 family metallopeptidase n=1 Tax=Caproiciproducens sp. CPB-2 TaxID=3030017 RepID=UPI003FA44D7D